MPLIQCPDCHNQISDSAPACPYCGRPMAAAQPQRAGNQMVQYRDPPAPIQQPVALAPAPAQNMQPVHYQQAPVAPMQPQQAQPIYHDPTAVFVDPEEPFRNNSLAGAIRGQASFRATFLWWLVGFAVFSFLAFEFEMTVALIPAIIWFWGGIFMMFWNARNIYSSRLKTIVFWALGIIFALMIFGAYGNG